MYAATFALKISKSGDDDEERRYFAWRRRLDYMTDDSDMSAYYLSASVSDSHGRPLTPMNMEEGYRATGSAPAFGKCSKATEDHEEVGTNRVMPAILGGRHGSGAHSYMSSDFDPMGSSRHYS